MMALEAMKHGLSCKLYILAVYPNAIQQEGPEPLLRVYTDHLSGPIVHSI